ncbi:hypothetical protein ACFSTC_59630 [Nonomuraea ferruginea]
MFAGPLIRRPGEARLSDLLAVAPARTLDGLARRYFRDARLRQYVGRYATYAGSNPYRAPAALGCVPALEHGQGVWYAPGGLARLADDLGLLLKAAGGAGVPVRAGRGGRGRWLRRHGGPAGERGEGPVGRRGGQHRRRRAVRPPAARPWAAAQDRPAGALVVGAAGAGRRGGAHARPAAPCGAVLGRLRTGVRRRLRPGEPAARPDDLRRLLGRGRPLAGPGGRGELDDAGQRARP